MGQNAAFQRFAFRVLRFGVLAFQRFGVLRFRVLAFQCYDIALWRFAWAFWRVCVLVRFVIRNWKDICGACLKRAREEAWNATLALPPLRMGCLACLSVAFGLRFVCVSARRAWVPCKAPREARLGALQRRPRPPPGRPPARLRAWTTSRSTSWSTATSFAPGCLGRRPCLAKRVAHIFIVILRFLL